MILLKILPSIEGDDTWESPNDLEHASQSTLVKFFAQPGDG
jgi:hypothetical protein